jgi:acetylornithine/succinyldiaminopimelate/putrescine aminotransferase
MRDCPLYSSHQGGTYNGNLLMTAINGAVLKDLPAPGFPPGVREKGDYLCSEVVKMIERFGLASERGERSFRALNVSTKEIDQMTAMLAEVPKRSICRRSLR